MVPLTDGQRHRWRTESAVGLFLRAGRRPTQTRLSSLAQRLAATGRIRA